MRTSPSRRSLSLALVLVALVTPLAGCQTRSVVDTVVDATLLQIRLRSEKKLFGEIVPRGFDHPAEISPERMRAILEGVEIDTSKDDRALVRERKSAISSKIIGKLSDRLAEAYAEAGPDQELVVVALRKQTQHGIFNRKYVTSFVTYIRDGELYIHLSRIEYKIEEHQRSELPPDPRPGDDVMPFRTVSNALYEKVGAQGLRVDWQSRAFGSELLAEEAPVVAESAAESEPAAATPSDATEAPAPSAPARIEDLDSSSLRALADLEDAHAAGRIDDAEYERRRRAILGPPKQAP